MDDLIYFKALKSVEKTKVTIYECRTVDEIYTDCPRQIRTHIPDSAGTDCTPIFSFFLEKVFNIAILELGLVSNERPGNSTF